MTDNASSGTATPVGAAPPVSTSTNIPHRRSLDFATFGQHLRSLTGGGSSASSSREATPALPRDLSQSTSSLSNTTSSQPPQTQRHASHSPPSGTTSSSHSHGAAASTSRFSTITGTSTLASSAQMLAQLSSSTAATTSSLDTPLTSNNGGLISPSSSSRSEQLKASTGSNRLPNFLGSLFGRLGEGGQLSVAEGEDFSPASEAWQIEIRVVQPEEELFLSVPTTTASPSRTHTKSPVGRSKSPFGKLLSPSSAKSNGKRLSKKAKRSKSADSDVEPTAEEQTSILLIVYVTAPLKSLTLYRSLDAIKRFDAELRNEVELGASTTQPDILRPVVVEPKAASNNAHARRGSVFSMLSRTLLVPSTSREAAARARPSSPTPDDDAQAIDITSTSTLASSIAQPSPASLSGLAEYLSSLSSRAEIRESQAWITFFNPGKDDHVSEHLETSIAESRSRSGTVDKRSVNGKQRESKTVPSSPRRTSVDLLSASTTTSKAQAVHASVPNESGGLSPYKSDADEGGDLTASPSLLQYVQQVTALENEPIQPQAHHRVTYLKGSLPPTEVEASSTSAADISKAPRPNEAIAMTLDEQVKEGDLDAALEEAVAKVTDDTDTQNKRATVNDINPSGTLEEANDVLLEMLTPEHASTSPFLSPEASMVSLTQAEPHEAEMTDALTELSASLVNRESVGHNGRKGKSRKRSRITSTDSSAADDESSLTGKSHLNGGPQITDFDIIRVIGKGCAGKVLMCKYQPTGKLYAIKALHKYHVLAHRELGHTLTEQSILKRMTAEVKNPFVVRLRWSFQDSDNLFLALDFHSGGDLATQLARWGRLGVDRTRFYTAEIIEGLQGLHDAGIIYRDLKPENILLAKDGHIILTDFGLSKAFQRASNISDTSSLASSASRPQWLRDSGRSQTSPVRSATTRQAEWSESTSTFCGTAEYLAPEVLLGHQYSYPVDLWSLGTMMHEMLVGVTPFYDEDHSIMYNRVIKEPLDLMKQDRLDADTKALLRGLLRKEPEFRMTTKRVKKAKYFEAIDWQLIYDKRYIPPFIPDRAADNPEDTQNFDDIFVKMDLGLADPVETAEIEAKAAASGKPFDSAFDEMGRDVFASYSYTALADAAEAEPEEDAEIEKEEEPATASDETSKVVEDNNDNLEADESFRNDTTQQSFRNEDKEHIFRKSSQASETGRAASTDVVSASEHEGKPERTVNDEEVSSTVAQEAGVVESARTHHRHPTSPGASTEHSIDSRAGFDSSDQGYDTGITSASATDDNLVKHGAEASSHGRGSSSGLDPVIEKRESLESAAESDSEPAHSSEVQQAAATTCSESQTVTSQPSPPPKVELPRASIIRSRVSEEGEDWHLIDAAEEEAANGMPKNAARRRVMAGTSLWSQGIIDLYRLQVKPSASRANTRPSTPTKGNPRTTLKRGASLLTPAKWIEAAKNGSRRGSTADLGLTSPSESSIGHSGTSLLDTPEQVSNASQADLNGKKNRMPYLTMRLTSSGSPSSKFRLKRGKKATDIEPDSSVTDLAASPQSSTVQTPGSAATLPIEDAPMRMEVLSRQPATPSDSSQTDLSTPNTAEAGDKTISARLKQKRTRFDPTKLSLFQIKTEEK